MTKVGCAKPAIVFKKTSREREELFFNWGL